MRTVQNLLTFQKQHCAAHNAEKDINYINYYFQQNQSWDVRMWEVEQPSSGQFPARRIGFLVRESSFCTSRCFSFGAVGPRRSKGAARRQVQAGSSAQCRCFLVLLREPLEGGDAAEKKDEKRMWTRWDGSDSRRVRDGRKRAFQPKPGGGASRRFNKS